MIWHILRYWISFFVPTFYKRLQAKHLEYILGDNPVIIAMNHPNAFTDPILITTLTHPVKLKFMARGDVFKPGLIARSLEAIGIVPIFRIQDGGKEGLKMNEDAYRRVNKLLSRNNKIIVFAEGLCIQERRLRPIKKGVARMVFGAYEAIGKDNLTVVPIGVNYSNPSQLRSDAFYNIGEPIPVKDLIDGYQKNPARAQKELVDLLESRMKQLVTHIQNPDDDEAVLQVETLHKLEVLKNRGMNPNNLEQDFVVLNELTEKVNSASLRRPDLLSEFKTKAKIYFNALKENKLSDWVFDPIQNQTSNPGILLLRLIFLLVGLPFYLIGLTGNYFPFWLTNRITKKLVKNIEFYSSFWIGFAMLIFLFNYVLWFLGLYAFFPSIIAPTMIVASFALCAWFSLYYHPFMRNTFTLLRYFKQKALADSLRAKRNELLSIINKF